MKTNSLNPSLTGLALAAAVVVASLLVAVEVKGAKPPGGGGSTPTDTGTIYFGFTATNLWKMNPDGSSKGLLVKDLNSLTQAGLLPDITEPSHAPHNGHCWFLTFGEIANPQTGLPQTYPSGLARYELFAVSDDGLTAVQLTDAPSVEPAMVSMTQRGDYGQARWLPNDSGISYLGRAWGKDDLGNEVITEVGVFVASVDAASLGLPAFAAGPVQFVLALPTVEDPQFGIYPGASNFGFDWSPDGTSAVYATQSAAGQLYADAYTVDSAGTVRLLAANAKKPRWSPLQANGRSQIAFFGGGGYPVLTLQTINPDGTGKLTLATSSGTMRGKNVTGYGMQWSPHGSHLLYQHAEANFTIRYVYRVKVDGTGNNALTDKSFSPAYALGWKE